MKLQLNDLIPDRYYMFSDNTKYYLKYKKHTSKHIHCYNFYIVQTHFNGYEYGYDISDIFCGVDYYKNFRDVCEIDISLIIEYLPDDNSDKKIYMRRIKIDNLLNGNT